MATRFVGPGGSDANSGLTWALRKLTLNGVEDTPVVAGDIVYVAPGVYRETLTVDVNGTAGNIITYIADISGENTDGVGGVVRITGSDNDQTATRANCIIATTKSYRTFRGFSFDGTTSTLVGLVTSCTNIIVEDCTLQNTTYNQICISVTGPAQANVTIRRCRFYMAGGARAVDFSHTSTVDNTGHMVENCVFHGSPTNVTLATTRIGGITVRNCLFMFASTAIQVLTALTSGQLLTINNCIINSCANGISATTSAEVSENYNSISNVGTARNNVAAGANSNAFPPLFYPLVLLAGYVRPQLPPHSLSEWSQLRAIAGTNEASDDLRGITRPTTSAKKSWGPVQSNELGRETTTVRTGAASLRLGDAGRHQMFVPTTAVSTTISVYAQWEADYAGTKPQLTVKQPGQADQTDTATGSSGTWEQLSITLTPAAAPGYVVVELVSNNTATSGNFDCFFDDLVVS